MDLGPRTLSRRITTRFVRACRIGAPLLLVAAPIAPPASPVTGRQFFHLTHFEAFNLELLQPQRIRLTSPCIGSPFEFDQLIASWNVSPCPSALLKIEAQPLFSDHAGRWYILGFWAPNGADPPSHSVPKQSDSDAEVKTDLLVLAKPARQFKIRLTLEFDNAPIVLKFLGVSVLNSGLRPAPPAPAPGCQEMLLTVPARSQMDYLMGGAWCSPTCVSMVLSYWAARDHRPDLDRDVPEVAAGVDDPSWPGTGNWSFNAAYAGSFPGMRGYVTRLANVAELEPWIAAGVPVVASVSYSLLKGEPDTNDGHLVVVVGFDSVGAVIVNDPGTRHAMRKTVPRDQFAAAWSHSRNTVYLIYPADRAIPASPEGHW